jgi:hypothetical protein
MSDVCETVRIVAPESPQGFVVVNKADVAEGDQLFEGEPAVELTPDAIVDAANEGEGDA